MHQMISEDSFDTEDWSIQFCHHRDKYILGNTF